MNIIDEIFERRKPKNSKVATFLAYGFVKQGEMYNFTTDILNGDFRVEITINPQGEISGRVMDLISDNEYDNIHVTSQKGAFVNRVREAYREVLLDVAEACFIERRFFSEQGNELATWVESQWAELPDTPFKNKPETGAFRNPNNNKWYALISMVATKQLMPDVDKIDKEAGELRVEILNIKVATDSVVDLVREDGIFPAYHMNKKHWVTVTLDGRVQMSKIKALVSKSRDFTLGKVATQSNKYPRTEKTKAWIVPANPKYFDVIKAFAEKDIITWKQGASMVVGDSVFLYLGAPYSAILYHCLVIETDLAYQGNDDYVNIKKCMRIKKVATFDKSRLPFKKLKTYGVTSVRSARGAPDALINAIKVLD